jgi:hypothetical protein
MTAFNTHFEVSHIIIAYIEGACKTMFNVMQAGISMKFTISESRIVNNLTTQSFLFLRVSTLDLSAALH